MHSLFGKKIVNIFNMSRKPRHINHNITNEGSYAILQNPTTATFISEEIMETNEEKERIRQESQVVHNESKLVKDKETEG